MAVLLDNFVEASADMEADEDNLRYQEKIKSGPVAHPPPLAPLVPPSLPTSPLPSLPPSPSLPPFRLFSTAPPLNTGRKSSHARCERTEDARRPAASRVL